MTKQEALLAMNEGNKITHRYFDKEEYLYIKDGVMYMENNNRFQLLDYDGWADRSGGAWEMDWRIYKEVVVNG